MLSHENTAAVLPVALEVLADEQVSTRTRRAAASTALRADGRALRSATSRGLKRLRLGAADRRRVNEVLSWTTLEQERQDSIHAATIDELVRDQRADADDAALSTLVHTALREPHLDVRDTALAVLLLSPRAAPSAGCWPKTSTAPCTRATSGGQGPT